MKIVRKEDCPIRYTSVKHINPNNIYAIKHGAKVRIIKHIPTSDIYRAITLETGANWTGEYTDQLPIEKIFEKYIDYADDGLMYEFENHKEFGKWLGEQAIVI